MVLIVGFDRLTGLSSHPCRLPLFLRHGRVAETTCGIASAVEDAIGMPGAITSIPITPQRLKRILDGGRSGSFAASE